jgi:2-polyprenyl-6-methoxyphenol hydroxylase-like FAD-dependent oxidoreductase
MPTLRPDQPGQILGLQCRRLTFERILRSAAEAQPGLDLWIGHADQICVERGRAVGLVIDGRRIDADLILDASGRAGRLGRGYRAPAEGGDCGLAYVSRQHELLPGAEPGPTNAPVGLVATFSGYQVIVFQHDNRILSTLIARASGDDELAQLREPAAFEAACATIPALAAWTEPGRTRPITAVMPGAHLHNSYQGQQDVTGKIAVDGLIFVGDSVSTTNPTAGRGVATSLMQAQRLLALLDENGRDFNATSLALQAWCDAVIRPWFEDHVYWDAEQQRRWAGEDIDLTKRLPSDLIFTAAQAAPEMMRVVGPYLGMQALPASLAAVEPRARELYASGWRPPVPEGPSRDELAAMIGDVLASRRQSVGVGAR